MSVRNIRNTKSSQVNPIFENDLNQLVYQLSKSLWLCASSAVSMAIALSAPVVDAKEQLPVHADKGHADKSVNVTLERSSPIQSAFLDKQSIIANTGKGSNEGSDKSSDQGVLGKGSQVAPAQNLPAALTQPGDSIQSAQQSLSHAVTPTEPPIESTDIESTEPVPGDRITQSDAAPSELVESSSNPTSNKGWQFSVQPYFFVPFDVQGDVTVAGRSASLDLGLDDILNFDRAFDAGLRLEAQHDRLGFILDAFYIFAGQSGTLGVTLPEGSLQRFGINTAARLEGDASLFVRELTIDSAVSYRVVDTVLGGSASSNAYPRLIVAPIVGLRTRFLSQEVEVDTVRLGNFSLPVDQEFNASNTTIEPLVGAQIGLDLSNRWTINARGDVSGFDINADQDSTWNLFVGTQYHISPSVSLQLAYRFSGFDFEDGEGLSRTRVNLYQNGVWLSSIFRF